MLLPVTQELGSIGDYSTQEFGGTRLKILNIKSLYPRPIFLNMPCSCLPFEAFIIVLEFLYALRSSFTSCSGHPEPLAILFTLEAFIKSGSAFSSFVIDCIINLHFSIRSSC